MMRNPSGSQLQPPWMWRFLIGAVALPLLLVWFAQWLDGEYARMGYTADLVETITVRRGDAQDLLASLRKAETAQRGYVITRNPRFLQSYEPSRRTVVRCLRALEQDGAPGRPTQLVRLRALVDQKFAEMDAVLRVLRSQGQAAAELRVSDGRGQVMTDRVENELQALIKADADRLASNKAAFWQRTHRSRQVVWVLVIVMGALMMVGMLLLWVARRERWRVMMAETDASVRSRTVLDSTSDAIVILNPSGTIENVNAAARSVLGYEPAELSRRDISVVIDIADGDGSFHERIGLVEGKLRHTLFVDRNARTKDGRVIPVDVALGLMPVPDGLHVVASIRDISYRREIERIKDDFIATVSHELRTPLTSVVGSLGLLRGGVAGALPGQAAQLVEIAENNARRLIRLTNDILDLEKFGSGQMTLEMVPGDLVAILRQAMQEAEVPAQAKSVRLEMHAAEQSGPIIADQQRLLQVATNLLSNAVRHTPQGSTVTVAVQIEQGRAIARICDEGPGVPDEYREHIFDRFVQAPAAGAVGGTGLGLAIAREIIHRHGGTIWVEAAAGGGACFGFALACMEGALPSDYRAAAASPDHPEGNGDTAPSAGPDCSAGHCPLILQIDDDLDLAKVVAASMAGEAQVIQAHGLAEARSILERQVPDIVILDIGLPDGSGVDILPLLVDRQGQPLPTIVFSAQDSPLEVSGRVEAVLTKSRSSLPTLRATIRRILADRTLS